MTVSPAPVKKFSLRVALEQMHILVEEHEIDIGLLGIAEVQCPRIIVLLCTARIRHPVEGVEHLQKALVKCR